MTRSRVTTVRTKLLAVAICYTLLRVLTATIGVSSIRRAALRDPSFGQPPADCIRAIPTWPRPESQCYNTAHAPAPFIVRAEYGLSGVESGWRVRTTVIWLFGALLTVKTDRLEI
jgi:hypothetical protein